MAAAPSDLEIPDAYSTLDDFLASASEHQFQGYSIDDIQNFLADGGQIYQELRVQSDNAGTITYKVPVQDDEIAYLMGLQNRSVQPYSVCPFPVTKIRDSGRPDKGSIVLILLGDGFTAEQYGTWPNPAQGTVLHYAEDAINAMLNTHPYGIFANLFTVYVIHAFGINPDNNGRSYLGTVAAKGDLIKVPSKDGTSLLVTAQGGEFSEPESVRKAHIRELANAIVPAVEQNMIQIISNASGGTGYGALSWYNQLGANIAVSSLRNEKTPIGDSNSVWPNGTAWQGTFIHEFGHSFGGLVDEHKKGTRDEERANSTQEADSNIKWRHWAGYRNVLATPERYEDGWAVPAGSGCIMRASWANRNYCGVCAAELVRRLALVSGEPFYGRSPRTDDPLPDTPEVTIPNGTTRILDSAFHGNKALHTVNISSSVSSIGDYAFIGATGLRTIVNHRTTPQEINETTFAGVNRSNVDLYVPAESIQDYINAGWSGFRSIQAANRAITYDANGGSWAPVKQEGYKNEIVTLATKSPTRFGYNFLGWSTDRAADHPTYQPGSQVRLTEDVTLYAVWDEARTLELDNIISGYVDPGEDLYYQFTPASTGLYQFSLSCEYGSSDPNCNWYRTETSWQDTVSLVKDDTSVSSSSWLEAGKKYYLKIKFPNASQTSWFNFQLTEAAVTNVFVPGTYKIGCVGTENCLDAVGYGLENATEVQLFSYNNQSNQNWKIQRTEDGYYTISPVYNPEQCLTFVQNYKLLLNARDGSNSQKWIIQTHRDYCKLIPKSDTGSTVVPTTLPTPPIEDRVRSTDSYDAPLYRGGFLWRINPVWNPEDTVVELAPGTYRIQNLNSSMYLHGWYNASDGSAGLYQDVYTDGTGEKNQIWIVRDAGEGYRYLSPACHPDLYVTFISDVGRCSLMPRSGADQQKWKVLEGADGYSRFMLKSAPGHVMVVQYASTIRYESIIVYGDNGSSNGKWIVTPEVPQRTVADGVYEMQNVNSGLYFDACNFGTGDGTRILQWSHNGGFNQRFRVKYVENGFYTLSPVYASGLYLAAFDNGTVKLTTNGVSDVSLWRILQNPDGSYRFSPKSDLDKAAVVQYASTEVGAEIILYDDNGSTNGWWKLDPVLSATELPTLQDTMYSIQNQHSGLSVCYDLEDTDKTLNQGRGDFAYWGSLNKDGYYTFQQYEYYGNYISVDRDGRTIITDCLSDEDSRLWKVMDDGRIYSKKYPDKVLAVENDSMERGARLILVDAGTTNSEQWSFVLA